MLRGRINCIEKQSKVLRNILQVWIRSHFEAYLYGLAWLHVEQPGQTPQVPPRDSQELLPRQNGGRCCCRYIARYLHAGRRGGGVQLLALLNLEQGEHSARIL